MRKRLGIALWFAVWAAAVPVFAGTYLYQFRVPIFGVPPPPPSSLTQTFEFYPLGSGGSYVAESGGQQHAAYSAPVPSWATKAVVTVVGAGGGYTECAPPYAGGYGIEIQATLPVPPGTTTATITVGGMGSPPEGYVTGQEPGAGGGGLSSVDIGGEVVFAGSGGGAGTDESATGPCVGGGNGGYPNGELLTYYSANSVDVEGQGGVTAATASQPTVGPGAGGSPDPGCYVAGNAGTSHTGGAPIASNGPCHGAGGGGSGYYGGGGGSLVYNDSGGGGGGGSSYISPNAVNVVVSSPTNSGNGTVIITWKS